MSSDQYANTTQTQNAQIFFALLLVIFLKALINKYMLTKSAKSNNILMTSEKISQQWHRHMLVVWSRNAFRKGPKSYDKKDLTTNVVSSQFSQIKNVRYAKLFHCALSRWWKARRRKLWHLYEWR